MGHAARRKLIPFPENDDGLQPEKPQAHLNHENLHEVDDLWFAIFARLLEKKKHKKRSRQT